jgi:hypothetical protein
MELASMLGGERFSDHPDCVSPVIAGFLRTYNDALFDDRRQDLHGVVARVVGTRTGRRDEKRRAELCLEWLGRELGPEHGFFVWLLRFWPNTYRKRLTIAETAARHAAASRERHEAALNLVDRMAGTERFAELIPAPARVAAAEAAA